MPTLLTDVEIQALLFEPKQLPSDFESELAVKPKRGHSQGAIGVEGASGSQFSIHVRLSQFNPLDFSVILSHEIPGTNRVFRLRRYNGKSHEHSNKLEGNRLYGFHIHHATERYQLAGFDEDAYAEVTDRYSTVYDAQRCLIEDCGFVLPPGHQADLFATR